MNQSKLIIAAVALAGALGAGLAQAHDDVQWSVTVGTPGMPVYRQPVPVPVYRQPVPVAVPVYSVPVAPAMVYRDYRPTRWDRDGDGIPNRRDPLYNPRWDRDGDGVPNWRDRHDDRRDGYRPHADGRQWDRDGWHGDGR